MSPKQLALDILEMEGWMVVIPQLQVDRQVIGGGIGIRADLADLLRQFFQAGDDILGLV